MAGCRNSNRFRCGYGFFSIQFTIASTVSRFLAQKAMRGSSLRRARIAAAGRRTPIPAESGRRAAWPTRTACSVQPSSTWCTNSSGVGMLGKSNPLNPGRRAGWRETASPSARRRPRSCRGACPRTPRRSCRGWCRRGIPAAPGNRFLRSATTSPMSSACAFAQPEVSRPSRRPGRTARPSPRRRPRSQRRVGVSARGNFRGRADCARSRARDRILPSPPGNSTATACGVPDSRSRQQVAIA